MKKSKSKAITLQKVMETMFVSAQMGFDKEDMIVSNKGKTIRITQTTTPNSYNIRKQFEIIFKVVA